MSSFKVLVIVCLVISTALSKPLEESTTSKPSSENIDESKSTNKPKAESLGKSLDEVTTEAISSSVPTTPRPTQKLSDIKLDETSKPDERQKPEVRKDFNLPERDTQTSGQQLKNQDRQLPEQRQRQFNLPSRQSFQPPSSDQRSANVNPEDQDDSLTIIKFEAIPVPPPIGAHPIHRSLTPPLHRRPYFLPAQRSVPSYFNQNLPNLPQSAPAFTSQILPSFPQQGYPPLHHGFYRPYRDLSDEWDDLYDSDSDEDDYDDYLKANYLRQLHGLPPRPLPYSLRRFAVFTPTSGQLSSPVSQIRNAPPTGTQYGSQFPYRSIVKRDVADEMKEMKQEDKKSNLEITKNVEDAENPDKKESRKLDDSPRTDVLSSKRDPNVDEKLDDKVQPSERKGEKPSKDEDISVIHIIDVSPSDPFEDANFGSILRDPIFSPFSMFHRPAPRPLIRPIPVIVVQSVEGTEGDMEPERDESMTQDDEKPFEQTKPNEALVNFKLGQDKARLKMRLPQGKGHYELKNGRGMARAADFEVEANGDFKLHDSKNMKDDSKKRMFSLQQGDFGIELNLDRGMRL